MSKNMPISTFVQGLLPQITMSEGIRDKWYKDTEGVDTVGIGFTKPIFEGLEDDDYRTMLGIFVFRILRQIIKEFKWFERMPDLIRAVVFEMCYQLGVKGFKQFKKTINHLKNKQWKEASIEMLDSKWAKEQTPERAKRLSDMVAQQGKPLVYQTGGKIIDVTGRTLFDTNA